MAVVENEVHNSPNRTESVVQNNTDQSKSNLLSSNGNPNNFRPNDQNNNNNNNHRFVVKNQTNGNGVVAAADQMSLVVQQHIKTNGVAAHHHQQHQNQNQQHNHDQMNGEDDDGGEGFKKEMRDLEEMLSKLNPMAEEFVPLSLANFNRPLLQQHYAPALPPPHGLPHFGYITADNTYLLNPNSPLANGNSTRRKKISYSNAKKRMNTRTNMAQREDVIRRTVYVSDIDHQVTEEQLAALFIGCGQVVDCRVCGDPNSVLRFAFVEFTDEEGARNALSLAGTMLGFYPVRVLPSKTAIAPVNPTFLPRSEDEREMCARTIYCTNIDKKITQADVKLFFESICGEVLRLRLLGDYHHSTRIAFVEFVMAESAIAALNCSGAVLGSLPIRVSPSKTPVRPRAPRPGMH